jgi:hypothetical protein
MQKVGHRLFPMLVLSMLAACSQGGPRLGIGLGPGGVSLSPRVATHIGPVTLGAGPDGLSAGVEVGL